VLAQDKSPQTSEHSAVLARQVRILTIGTLLITIVLDSLQVAANWSLLWHNLISTTFCIVLASCVLVISKYKGPRLAAKYLITGGAVLIFWLTWSNGGMHSPSLCYFIPLILMAGLLLGMEGGGTVATVAALWLLALLASEQLGWLPGDMISHNPGSLAVVYLLHLAIIGLTLYLILDEHRRLQRNREQAKVEQLKAQEALDTNEKRLELAFSATNDGFYDLDLATGSAYWSPRCSQMLGREPGEMPTQLADWIALVHPVERTAIQANFDRYSNDPACQEHNFECRLRAQNGSWHWILNRGRLLQRDALGRPKRLVGTVADITLQKHSETELRQAKDFAEKIISTAPILIIGLDTDGCIVASNIEAETSTGYTKAELAGRNCFETLVPRERFPSFRDKFLGFLEAGRIGHLEHPLLTKSGEERIVDWHCGTLRHEGRTTGAIYCGVDVTRQRITEHALAKERDLVHRLVETSPAAILVLSPAGVIRFANTEAERILDLQRSDTNQPYAEAEWDVLSETGEPIRLEDRPFRRVLSSGRPIRDTRQLLRWPGGRQILVNVNAAPLLDAAGKPEGIVATIDDITESEESNRLLRQNEERQRNIIDHAPFGAHLYRLEPDGNLVLLAANRSADNILQISHASLVGKTILDAFPGLVNTTIPDIYRQVVTSGQPYHYPQVRYDTSGIAGAFDVHAMPIGSDQVVVFFADITERERAETALRLSEERYRLLFNSGNDGVFVHGFSADGRPGKFTQVNDVACQMLEYSREELLGMRPQDLSTSDMEPRIASAVGRLHAERHALFEMELRKRDGRKIYVEINSRVFDLEDQPTVLSVVRDISERRQLEAQLRQAQKMEVFGQLAGGVAHDFNNLLVAIIGNADLLVSTSDPTEQSREHINEIKDAAERAGALTRQLLVFARKHPLNAVPCELNSIVTNHTKLLLRIIGEDIDLSLKLSARELHLHADPNMIEQVLMNLAVNARDAMPAGGRLVMGTTATALGKEAAAARQCQAGNYAVLSVSDNGCGIPASIQMRIFEPFFTTKQTGRGTGLGLSTVLGIVQQHKGGILVESQEGQGSTFSIYLPLTPAAGAQVPTSVTSEPQRVRNATILVVEDEPSVRMIVERTLKIAGYRVLTADCVASAIARIDSATIPIDLVLSDIVMPGGEGGLELAEQLDKRVPPTPIVFMSGYNNSIEDLGRPLLPKPFSNKQLVAFVGNCLDRLAPPPHRAS
jgi:PAS domain S-box-containing protein